MTKNAETVLAILQDEVNGDVAAALQKMVGEGYSMTWMYAGKTLFPRSERDPERAMREDIYVIKGRTYDIRNIAEGEDVVMVELIESYPDPASGSMHRTPLVIVLEMNDGKIAKGRHYCDPRISASGVDVSKIEDAYAGTTTKILVR